MSSWDTHTPGTPRHCRRSVRRPLLSGCGAAETLTAGGGEGTRQVDRQPEGRHLYADLVGSESDINALLNNGAALSDDERKGLDLVRNGHISFSVANGTFGLEVKAGSLDRAFELRYVGQKLYVRAEVAEIAKLARHHSLSS